MSAEANSEIEKIDLIIARTGVTYKEARKALEEAGADAVRAIINLEAESREFGRKVQGCDSAVVDQLKVLWKKSLNTRFLLKRDERTVAQIPVLVGALGLVGILASSELALLATLGAVTAMAKRYSFKIARPDIDMDDRKH